MTATPAPVARPGDTIVDPSGGRNRVLDTHTGRNRETGARVLRRLLLADQDGFRFVLHARWLQSGWTWQPSYRQRAEKRFAPAPARFEHRARYRDPERASRHDRRPVGSRP